MYAHDLILAGIAFVSEIIGTLSGFGSSTVFVPAALYFEKFHFVLALTSILHCFGNIAKIYLFRQHFRADLFFRLAVPFVAFVLVGALLVNYLPVRESKLALGIVLIVVGTVFLFTDNRNRQSSRGFAKVLSGVSGFSTGLVGTGGAIRGLALASLQIEKNSFVMLSSAIDFGGDFVRMIVYLFSGFMDWSQWYYIPLLMLASYTGAKLGKYLLGFINQWLFEKIVAVCVLVAGIAMVASPH